MVFGWSSVGVLCCCFGGGCFGGLWMLVLWRWFLCGGGVWVGPGHLYRHILACASWSSSPLEAADELPFYGQGQLNFSPYVCERLVCLLVGYM